MNYNEQIINSIPKEVLSLREDNNLHKLASLRTGIEDFGLDSAVTHLAKKAFYARRVNRAIANGINSLTHYEE